ncbi:MAG: glutamine synthetase type III, partial [Armatimonadota bacterium]
SQILPAVMEYSGSVASAAAAVASVGTSNNFHKKHLDELCSLIGEVQSGIADLESALEKTHKIDKIEKEAASYRDNVIPAMNKLRESVDALETIVDADIWPLPTYAEMLFIK